MTPDPTRVKGVQKMDGWTQQRLRIQQGTDDTDEMKYTGANQGTRVSWIQSRARHDKTTKYIHRNLDLYTTNLLLTRVQL